MWDSMKRVISMMLAIMMFISMMPVDAMADAVNSPWTGLGANVYADRAATSIQPNETANIKVGESVTLRDSGDYSRDYGGSSWSISPNNSGLQITEQNSLSNVATVKGVTPGEYKVNHTYYNNYYYGWHSTTETFTVNVTSPVAPTGLTITGASTMAALTYQQLVATFEPEDAYAEVTWSTSDDSILRVDEKTGLVFAAREGTATITATAGNSLTNSITIIVGPADNTQDDYIKDAKFYYYVATEGTPDTNAQGNIWSGPYTENAKINIEGANWQKGHIENDGKDYTGIKNCYDNVIGRVVRWPDNLSNQGTLENGKLVVTDHNTNAWSQLKETYINKYRGNEDDLVSIIITPYKISDNTDDGYHVDCDVDFVAKQRFTASYYLWDTEDVDFTLRARDTRYLTGDETEPDDFQEVSNLSLTKTDKNGVIYNFVGWYTNRNLTGEPVKFPYTIQHSSVEFYARYVAGYKVIYDLDGGSWKLGNYSVSVNEGATHAIVEETPTRTGYKFEGWKVDTYDDLTQEQVNIGSFTMPPHNVRLTAQWSAHNMPYTIHYYEKDTTTELQEDYSGEAKINSKIVIANLDSKLKPETITKDGKTYTYDSAYPEVELVITGTEKHNVITLYYTCATGDLTVTKKVVDHVNTSDDAARQFTFYLKAKNAALQDELAAWAHKQGKPLNQESEYEFNIIVVGGTKIGTETLSGLPTGSYTVTENSTDASGRTYTVTDGASKDVTVQNKSTTTVEFTNTLKTAELTIEKTAEGLEGETLPESFTFTVSGLNGYSKTVTATKQSGSGNKATYKTAPLTLVKGSTYTITESSYKIGSTTYNFSTDVWTPTPANGVTTVKMDADKTVNFTNKRTGENTTITASVTKKWEDFDNEANKRSAAATGLTVTLTGKLNDQHNISEHITGWTGESDTETKSVSLPKCDITGQPISYTVTETGADEYTLDQSAEGYYGGILSQTNGYAVTLTNRYMPKVSVSGTKTWVDDGETTHDNANEITLHLFRQVGDDEPTQVPNQPTWNNNTYTFSNLDKYDGQGREYTYSVTEGDVEGYTSTTEGKYGFVNTSKETITISGWKTWVDGNNESNTRPTGITINLLADGMPKESKNVSDQDGWSWSFTNLPKYSSTSKRAIVYTITESIVSGYDSEVNGYNVTNTISAIDDKVTVNVKKTWVDGDDENKLRPSDISLTLKRKTTQSDYVTVTDASALIWTKSGNTWTASYGQLPKYDGNGYAYSYQIEEEAVDGYTATIAEPVLNGNVIELNVTNTISAINDKVTVNVKKTWVDGDDENKLRPSDISLTLKRKTTQSDYVTVTDAPVLIWTKSGNTWTASYGQLPKYDENGYTYEYTIVESGATGYTAGSVTSTTSSNGSIELKVTNTITQTNIPVSGTKTWVDASDATHPANDTLPLKLQSKRKKDGADPFTNVTSQPRITWNDNTYSFGNQPKYDSEGYELEYQVKEENVQGYQTTYDDSHLNITNTKLYNITVRKEWVDPNTEYNWTHPTVEFKLYKADGETLVDSEQLGADGSVTFENVPYGNYVVKEVMSGSDANRYMTKWTIGGETTDAAQATLTTGAAPVEVTNTRKTNGSFSVEKTVNGGLSIDTVDSLYFRITATSPKDTQTHETYVKNNETATFQNLILGETYTVAETGVYTKNGDRYDPVTNDLSAWTVAYSGDTGTQTNQVTVEENGNSTVTVTNTRVLNKTVTITKTWQDGGASDSRRPTVQKFAEDWLKLQYSIDGSKWSNFDVTPSSTRSGNVDTVTYSNLPEKSARGETYTYRVVETIPAGSAYETDTAVVTLTNYTGSLTNTLKKTLTISKVWKDYAQNSLTGVAWPVTAIVKNGAGATVTTVALTPDTIPPYTATVNLPVYDESNRIITYTVAEKGTDDNGKILFGEGNTAVEFTASVTQTGDSYVITNTKKQPTKTASISDAVTVTVGDETTTMVKVGGTISYEISYANATGEPATVTVTDNLPVGLAFKADDSTPNATTVDGQKVEWVIQNVPAMTSGKVTLVATVTDAAVGSAVDPKLCNTANIQVGDAAVETTPEEVVTVYHPSIDVTKELVDQTSDKKFALNESIRYLITVTNNGNVPLQNVTVEEKLDGTKFEKDTATYDLSNGDMLASLKAASFEPNESVNLYAVHVVTVSDIANQNHKVTNTVEAKGESVDGDDVTDSATCDASVDDPNTEFEATKTLTSIPATGDHPEKDYFTLGETVEFSITVTNKGNQPQDFDVEEMLSGAEFVDDTNTPPTYTTSSDLSGKKTKARVSNVAPGQSVTLKAKYDIQAADLGKGTMTNRVTVNNVTRTATFKVDEATSFAVTKTWSDTANKFNTRPSSVNVQLIPIVGNETANREYTLISGDNWTYTFDKLPAHNANGDEITYSVKELSGNMPVDDNGEITFADTGATYKVTYNNGQITNALKTMNVTVTKQWKLNGVEMDKDAAGKKLLPTVTFGLFYKKGTESGESKIGDTSTGVQVQNNEDQYTYTFENVPYRTSGYTVKEIDLTGGQLTDNGEKVPDAVWAGYFVKPDESAPGHDVGTPTQSGGSTTYVANAGTITNTIKMPGTDVDAGAIVIEKIIEGAIYNGTPSFTFEVTSADKTLAARTLTFNGTVKSGTTGQIIVPKGETVTVIEKEANTSGWKTTYSAGQVTVTETAQTVTVTNSYEPVGTWKPEVFKEVVREPNSTETFSFTIQENGKDVATGTVNGEGKITFTPDTITYTADNVGTHTYTIRENLTDAQKASYYHDGKTITAKVTVENKETDGTLTVTPTQDSTTFENYKLVDLTIVKNIDWKDTTEEDAEFTIDYSYGMPDSTPVSGTITATYDAATDQPTYTRKEDGKNYTDADGNKITVPFGTEVTVIETPDDKVWTKSIDGLDANKDCVTVDGAKTVTVTNTRKLYNGNGELTVKKYWKNGDTANNDLAASLIPGNIRVELTGTATATDGTVSTVTKTEMMTKPQNANDVATWTYTFTDLPATDLSGNAYTYEVKEVSESDGKVTYGKYTYAVTYNQTTHTITNTLQNQGEPTKPEKTVDQSSGAQPGDPVTFTIKAQNHLATTADVTVRDTLAKGLSLFSAQATYNGKTLDLNVPKANETSLETHCEWTFEDVPPMGEVVITLNARLTADAIVKDSITNTAKAQVGNTTETLSEPVTVTYPKLSITKTADPTDMVAPSGTITYTLTVTNSGAADATGVVVTDELPNEVTNVSSESEAVSVSGQIVTWNVGTIAANNSAELTFTVNVNSKTEAAEVKNTAKIAKVNGQDTDVSSAEVTTPIAKINIDKNATIKNGEKTASVGDIVIYKITVTNPNATALNDVVVTDPMFEKAEKGTLELNGNEETVTGNQVTIGRLGEGDSATITYEYKVVEGDMFLESISNTATATAKVHEVSITADDTANVQVDGTNGTLTVQKVVTDTTDEKDPNLEFSFTVKRAASNEEVTTFELKGDESQTIGGLGIGVEYIVTETGVKDKDNKALDAWTTTIDGVTGSATSVTIKAAENGNVTFTNTRKLLENKPDDPADDGKLTVKKVWQDGAQEPLAEQLYPQSGVTLVLKGGTEVYEGEVSKGNWTHTFEKLPAYSLTGQEYPYTVEERGAVNGEIQYNLGTEDAPKTFKYAVKVEDYVVTNTLQNGEGQPTEKAADETSKLNGVEIGDTITYTISRTSHLNKASIATITDALPVGLTYDADSNYTVKVNGEVRDEETVTFDRNASPLKWTVTDVPPMATVEVTVTLKVTEDAVKGDTITNEATVELDGDGTFESKPGREVVPVKQPKLTITKEADRAVVKPGDEIVYTVSVTNSGEGKATNVVVTDDLPEQLTYVSNDGNAAYADGTITWKIDTIEADDTKALRIVATVKPVENLDDYASIVNTAVIDDQPVDPEDKPTDTEETDIARATVEKSAQILNADGTPKADQSKASLNDIIRYTVVAVNTGSIDLTDVEVKDVMIGKAIAESIRVEPAEAATYAQDRSAANGSEVMHLRTLAVGQKVTFTYDYRVTEADILAGVVTNVATVSAEDPTDPGNRDDFGSDDTETKTDDPAPALTLTKEVLNAKESYRIGDTIEYRFTVTNMGNVTLANIAVDDYLTSASSAPESIDDTITLDGVALAPGQSAQALYAYTVKGDDVLPPYNADGSVATHLIQNQGVVRAELLARPETKVEAASNTVTVRAEQMVYIRFIDNMTGSIIKGVMVPYGGSTTVPADADIPDHAGYDFNGWWGGTWENVYFDQNIFTSYTRRAGWFPERAEGDLTILDAEIPLAGGYISNVGDCFD